MATATAPLTEFQRFDGVNYAFNLHEGQARATASHRRIILVPAGSQSGKTVIGPLWLFNEWWRCGPGGYLCLAPSYPLMQKKVLPEFLRFFGRQQQRLGYYKHTDRTFYVRGEESRFLFGHAEDPEAAESATAKAAWLDEAGQKRFRYETWEAVTRRLAIHRGRCLITTTPYNLGWLKTQVHDRAKTDPDIEVINFDSTANPAFPKEEYERARATMPGWRFRMFFQGTFTKPAGMIYDCFDEARNKCPRFTTDSRWPRYLGLDFGGVNTAGIFLAQDPQARPPRYYAYREYHAGGRTAKEHAAALLAGEPGVPVCVGGSKSEGQWRDEFRAAGLPVREPAVSDVEVGIDRVYGAVKDGSLVVSDDLAGLLDDGSYSREVDALGQPTEKIEDKESYHRLDAIRYLKGWLRAGGGQPTLVVPPAERRW